MLPGDLPGGLRNTRGVRICRRRRNSFSTLGCSDARPWVLMQFAFSAPRVRIRGVIGLHREAGGRSNAVYARPVASPPACKCDQLAANNLRQPHATSTRACRPHHLANPWCFLVHPRPPPRRGGDESRQDASVKDRWGGAISHRQTRTSVPRDRSPALQSSRGRLCTEDLSSATGHPTRRCACSQASYVD